MCHFGVTGGDQYALADHIAKLITKNFSGFASRADADRTHRGKIYYVQPGCVPSFKFYEVVAPADIQRIETLARQSLKGAGIEKVRLVFYEKQNWIATSAGGGYRGHEIIIKNIVVTTGK